MYILQRLSGLLYAAGGSLAALAFVIPAANDTLEVVGGRREGPLFGTPKPLDQLAETAAWLGWPQAQTSLSQAAEWAGAENRVPVELTVATLLVMSGVAVYFLAPTPEVRGPWQALTLTWLALSVLAQVGVGVWPYILGTLIGSFVLGLLVDGLVRWRTSRNYPPAGRFLRAFAINLLIALAAGPIFTLTSAHGL